MIIKAPSGKGLLVLFYVQNGARYYQRKYIIIQRGDIMASDKEMREIEKRIADIFAKQKKEYDRIIMRYVYGWNEIVDGEIVHHAGMYERKLMESLSTAYDERQFKAWWASQEGRLQYWIDARDQMKECILNADKIASDYVNGRLPSLYANASNDVARLAGKSALEQGVLGFRFDLVDEYTLRAIMDENREILPFKRSTVNIPKAERWNTKKLTDELYAGILNDDSVDEIAKRFQSVMKSEYSCALRNARTAINNARMAGKQDRMDELSRQGVTTMKTWVDVHDSVPPEREAHWEASGQTVPYDEKFIVGGEALRYPCDPDGSPWNIYNCRCQMDVGGFTFKSILSEEQRKRANIRVRR